jgi:hypothetical protein
VPPGGAAVLRERIELPELPELPGNQAGGKNRAISAGEPEGGGGRRRACQRELSGVRMKLFDPIAERFGVRQSQSDVLPKEQRVVGFDRLCVQQARELGHIIVREELRGVLLQESRSSKNI